MDLKDLDIRQYSNGLFEKWEIGSREYDNGLLIIVAPEDREIWIEVGYGLEGALPDSKIGNIINISVLPFFGEENYSEGILLGFNEIINEVEKEYKIELGREKINEEYIILTIPMLNLIYLMGLGKSLLVLGIIIFLFIDFKFFNGFLNLFFITRK